MAEFSAYEAATRAAAYTEISDCGWLRLQGRDRLDLLHRLSTNHVKELAPGTGAATVLTNASARIIGLLTVYSGSDAAHVRTMPGQAAGVLRYLQSMIFWQDDVQVADHTSEVSQFALYGPLATEALERITGVSLAGVPPYGWQAARLGGTEVTAHRGGDLEPWSWTIGGSTSDRPAMLESMSRAFTLIDRATTEIIRIESGLPSWGRELSDQVTPLETGLLSAVHFNKGCYTGQEVIARQTNYDKVTRNLVGLIFAPGVDFSGEGTSPLADVKGPGRGGFVGSAAYSPRLQRAIALAVVPRDLAQPGTTATVVRSGATYEAAVASLPFAP